MMNTDMPSAGKVGAGGPGLNERTEGLVDAMEAQARMLRIGVRRLDNGVRLIDAGIRYRGGLEAGRRVAEICLAGMGTVTLSGAGPVPGWPTAVHVHTSDPVVACLGSQYAGWSLSHGEGKKAFHALGSGPARALALKEPLFQELALGETSDSATLVLEVEQEPPLELASSIASACGVAPERLTLILTPTRSLAGNVQVVARVLEVAMHKAHELGFPLERIVDGLGSAPLPPPAKDFLTAMGRTNDAILFGGRVQLYVAGADDEAEDLCRRLPSSASADYGRPFAEVFKAYEYDFFRIDPMLFSPARVAVSCMESGTTFQAGALDTRSLEASFGVSVQ